jgi:hypothetical protein
VDDMCTVGGAPDIQDIETLAAKDYECLDCRLTSSRQWEGSQCVLV